MVRIKDITDYLESLAPLSYQESYDNCGLLTGNATSEAKGVLITLDVVEEVVEEAIQSGCNLIVAHHPIIFKGLKKLTGGNYVERTIIKAIQNNIAIYAIHTNLDHVKNGVNYKIAEVLGLKNVQILDPKSHNFKKLITFVPLKDALSLTKAIHEAGAGNIGNYSECSFQIEGIGSFKPNEEADPAIGKANELELVAEKRIEVIFPGHIEAKVLKALMEAHPYEEPAYDIILLENKDKECGAGVTGELDNSMSEEDFLIYLKDKMNLLHFKHTVLLGKSVQKVAICGGSGSFLLKKAIDSDSQIFITSDFKYHEYFDAENRIVIADIGHYESEVFTKDLIYAYLCKKFANIALVLSKKVTNPIRYL